MTNEQDRRWTVYLHVVPKQLSGYDWDKYYVGITGQSVQERWGGTGWGYLSQPYFYRAIQKYGWDNIRHLILKENLTKDEAINWEQEYIKLYCSRHSDHGYNLTAGGDGTNGMKHSEETRRNMSKNRSGSQNAFYGRKHTQHTRDLISKHHAPCSGKDSPRSKSVFQFDLQRNFIAKYDCISDVEKILGYPHQGISYCTIGRCKSSKGFLWRGIQDVEYSQEHNTYFIINDPYPRQNRKVGE